MNIKCLNWATLEFKASVHHNILVRKCKCKCKTPRLAENINIYLTKDSCLEYIYILKNTSCDSLVEPIKVCTKMDKSEQTLHQRW